jgi:regulator of cell morphogenesis and NO signaling
MAILDRIARLSDDFSPPPWACASYRGLLEGFSALRTDLLEHIRKEETLLYPKAIQLERVRTGG